MRGIYGDVYGNHRNGSNLLCADGHVVWAPLAEDGTSVPNPELRDASGALIDHNIYLQDVDSAIYTNWHDLDCVL
jgi:prepilin-type processing-associated H-X9-DG protein